MSDDERMDRAKRIRNLREGRRSNGQSESDDASVAETDGDGQSEAVDGAETAPERRSESGIAAEEASGHGDQSEDSGPSADPADDTVGTAGETADGSPDNPGEDDETASDPGETDDGDATDGDESDRPADPAGDDEDALAAAAAAAEAASAFEGDAQTVTQVEGEPPEQSPDVTEAESADTEVDGRDAGRNTGAERTRVLEFRLGEERYCLDIEYVEEIVREEAVTRVPNTPEYVNGVVDLRGQITTILDPKTTIGIEDDGEDQLIVVFDAETFDDHGYIGWLVDEVNQVMPITDDDVKDSPIQESYINGVIEDDGDFVIWTTPELALDVDEE